jgi:DNA-nicking Smr family endonuclease
MAKDSWEAAKAKKKLKDAPPPSFESEAAQAALFQAAMQGVTPLRAKSALSRPEPKPASEWQTPGPDQDDLMVMTALTDLVSGRIEFDLTYTDEYVEGHVKKFPPSTMDRLRQGIIPYQDHLDLHGLTLSQAEDAIYDFISKSLSLGRRCLLLIHGRGHRSPDGVPVIKRNLESLLLHRRVKRHILAFTTARPIDGGLGASYIYLAGTS